MAPAEEAVTQSENKEIPMNNATPAVTARLKSSMALRKQMGMPLNAVASDAITFASLDAPSEPMLRAMARKAHVERQDAVLALYRDRHVEDPHTFVLIYRTATSIEVLQVDPVDPGKTQPLVLVTEASGRVFQVDERGVVRERIGSTLVADKRNRARALKRIAREAKGIEADPTWEATHFGLKRGAVDLTTVTSMH
ncbi:hypothetical protein [Blastomonas sp.]|uniref:hypothetical protein n=1 Tax=Blastomonas sp. TaxID=1909299 RepID=UPI003593DE9D